MFLYYDPFLDELNYLTTTTTTFFEDVRASYGACVACTLRCRLRVDASSAFISFFHSPFRLSSSTPHSTSLSFPIYNTNTNPRDFGLPSDS